MPFLREHSEQDMLTTQKLSLDVQCDLFNREEMITGNTGIKFRCFKNVAYNYNFTVSYTLFTTPMPL